MSDETFWDGPDDRAEVVAGRYRVADPITGEVKSWTRASNIGAAVSDRWALERHAKRQLVRGLAARTDLLDLLKASVELDNSKCDEVIATALEVAGSTAKANIGTVIHEVQRRVDLGLSIPEGMERFAEGYTAALARAGLTVVAVEVLLCNRPLGAMGRGDRVYREADGSMVIGDTKSTAHIDLAQYEIAPQLATYGLATHIDSRGFVGPYARFSGPSVPEQPAWVPTAEHPIRQDYAIAVHVDRETGAVSFYRVDLYLGGYGANLATQVREWRTVKGILLPYIPPRSGVPGASENGRHLAAVPDPYRDPEVEQILGSDEVARQRRCAYCDDSSCSRCRPDPGTMAEAGGLTPSEQAASNLVNAGSEAVPGLLAAAELLRLSKAQVQDYARRVDPEGVGRDLAHQKANLVASLTARGKVAGGTPKLRHATMSADPAELPAGPATTGAEDPTDPRTDAFRRARLAEIAAAPSAAGLWRINRAVVRAGGDQAWSEEMTTAARIRVAELDGTGGVSPEGQLLGQVQRCTTPQAVADLWEEVTIGGSAADRWTPDIHVAAAARLEEIKAATAPPPANPFANQ